jgi:hypothetical protein
VAAIPMRIFWRLFTAAISMAALGYVTYVELDAASGKGGLEEWQIGALAGVVALFGPGQIAVRALAEWFGQVTYEQRLGMEEPAKACLVGLTEVTGIPFTEIGVTVFVVLRSRWHPVRGIQKRVVRLRMESTPAPTTVQWTKNKGLLGECWTQRRDASRDHAQQFDGNMSCTEEEWARAPSHVRQNLSYRDYQQIRTFGFVFAAPMIDPIKAHYHGCLVVQIPAQHKEALATTDALDLIHLSASLTCAVLK